MALSTLYIAMLGVLVSTLSNKCLQDFQHVGSNVVCREWWSEKLHASYDCCILGLREVHRERRWKQQWEPLVLFRVRVVHKEWKRLSNMETTSTIACYSM